MEITRFRAIQLKTTTRFYILQSLNNNENTNKYTMNETRDIMSGTKTTMSETRVIVKETKILLEELISLNRLF